MADETEIAKVTRARARHRMRGALSWPAVGARRARRLFFVPTRWTYRRSALAAALVLGLVVAAVGIAALPGRWRAAIGKPSPSPGARRLVEAGVGTVKRTLVLQGLVVHEPDREIRSSVTGTITTFDIQIDQDVRAGQTLAIVTLPTIPLPVIAPTPTPTPTVTPTPTPTASPIPTPSVLLPPPPPQVRSVTAPIDGTVKQVNVVVGQDVKAGKLLVILEPKRFDVIAPVPTPALYQFFHPPLALVATIERGPAPFDCSFISVGDNLDVTGSQTLLTQEADLRCQVPAALDVFPGVRVTLNATTAQADNAVVIPRGVVRFERGHAFVWLVERGHPAVRTEVQLGLTDGKVFQVTAGLAAGQRVLAQPPR